MKSRIRRRLTPTASRLPLSSLPVPLSPVAAAYAGDGTLEAMEASGDRFEVAVQWHPETRSDAGLFAGLVAAAAGGA